MHFVNPFCSAASIASKSSLQGPQEFDCCAFGFKIAMAKMPSEDHRILLSAKKQCTGGVAVVVEHGNLMREERPAHPATFACDCSQI